MQPYFVDFPGVMAHLAEYLDAECDRRHVRRVKLLMLVGSDMLKCGIHVSFPRSDKGLVVVQRHGFPLSHYGIKHVPSLDEQRKRMLFYISDEIEAEVSSSLIHKLFVEGRDFSHLVPVETVDILRACWSKDK